MPKTALVEYVRNACCAADRHLHLMRAAQHPEGPHGSRRYRHTAALEHSVKMVKQASRMVIHTYAQPPSVRDYIDRAYCCKLRKLVHLLHQYTGSHPQDQTTHVYQASPPHRFN